MSYLCLRVDESVRLAVLEERLRNMDKALEIQAKEYDRRLHELNHAHEQAVEVQHTYVTSQVHERDLLAATAARTAIVHAADRKAEALAIALEEAKKISDERFARVEAFNSKLLGAFALALLFIPALSGLVVYFISH